MKNYFKIELKIVSALVVAVILVAATGFFAYRSMTGIVQDVYQAVRPDARLTLLKQILSDLSQAESSVKSYSLAQNVDYLTPFYSSVSSVDSHLEELKRFSKSTRAQRALADSLNSLVSLKYALLDEMLALHYDERIANELKKISVAVEKKGNAAPRLSPVPEKRKRPFKLFGRKEPQAEAPVATPADQSMILKDIQQELSKAKMEFSKQLTESREKELALTQKGNEVMDDIRSLIAKAEKDELIFIAEKTRQAEARAKEANSMIAFFCAAIMLLLLIVGYVIVGYVRKSRKYGAALSSAKTEAENLAKARETFLANMSHEIRTPMNAIVGFTEQLLQSGLEVRQKEQLVVVKKSADHLLRIINDVLDFAKIQSGKLHMEETGFMPRETVNEVMVLMKLHEKKKDLSITHQIEPDVPEILIGDAGRIKQILLNLVSNAIKFTEHGEVSVHISSSSSENKTLLRAEIKDTGIGIPAERLTHVFEEFEQASNDTSQKYGGTGLGLTITKKLVEMQGGSIAIQSKLSEGTSVVFSIPYKLGTESDLPGTEPEIKVNGLLKGKNILVADDELYNRMLITAVTKKWGVHITESRSGEEALREVTNNRFDVVLMDVRMPGMDGFKASRLIRHLEDDQKAKVPIIALTAVTAAEDIEQCRQAGMNDFLAKPFKEKELYKKIIGLVYGKEENSAAVLLPDEKIKPDMKKYSLEGLRIMVKGDEPFFHEMIRVFISSTRDGFVQMREAYEKKDWLRIADAAHKIVSPCIHFEATRLIDLLKKIEKSIRERNETGGINELLSEASLEAEAILQDLEKKYR